MTENMMLRGKNERNRHHSGVLVRLELKDRRSGALAVMVFAVILEATLSGDVVLVKRLFKSGEAWCC